MLCVGVGLNNTGDYDEASSCSELLLGAWARLEVGVRLQLTDLKLLVRCMQGVTERVGLNTSGLLYVEARLVVGLTGGGGDWFWGESLVGGLNSGGEGLQLADFSLSIWGMQGVTDRNSLNWPFGVSSIVFTLSSCISWGSDSVSGEVIGVRFSM